MITEMVKGKRIEEALKISQKAVAEALDGLPKIKMHCSALAEDALKSAVKEYKRRGVGERKRAPKDPERQACGAGR
jgi:nitrogen fixation NifU-like protein